MVLPSLAPMDGEGSNTDKISHADSSQSLALAMAKSALPLMKEEDAAILERGVRDSCSSGRTPTLKPISASVALPVPNCLLLQSESVQALENSFVDLYESNQEHCHLTEQKFSHSNGFLMARLNPRCDSNESEMTNQSLLQAEQTNPTDDQRTMFRCCLSDDVRTRSLENELEESIAMMPEDGITSISPVSVAQTVRPPKGVDAIETQPLNDGPTRTGLKARSKSFDRRLNEAMQFAEAVGEMPPIDQSYVQVIIEETGSDDDEDSDVEVHIDSPMVPTASNVPSSRVVVPKDSDFDSKSPTEGGMVDLSHVRQKSRPQWPLPPSSFPSNLYLHTLPAGVNTEEYVYKGISSNPPEITTCGISRGNYAQLHRKAWLEVSDKYHRYGKNLRLYYKRWESLGFPTNQFFDWLDSKGEAAGQTLPNLDECPRSQLDADTVHYISNPEVTRGYAITIVPDEHGKGKVVDVDCDPVITGPEGWIFVLRDHTLYGAEKIASVSGHSKQRFHHSSFFGGKAVAAAGILITDEQGFLTRLYPHSGHYRPGEADIQRMLFHLHDSGVDLCTFEMDTQQILHVTRHDPPGQKNVVIVEDGEKKKRKIQSLHLKKAVYVACFLAHKARFIREGVFDQIHTIRKVDVTSVTEALRVSDNGGFWASTRYAIENERNASG